MLSFAAIDFETANKHYTSVCSVGIVIVRDGVLTEKFYSLVRPEPEWYAYYHTRIHGLKAKDTKDAKEFSLVWQEIAPKLKGLNFVAHGALFEEGCLKALFRKYKMDYPRYKFHCTLQAARNAFGDLLPNYKLPTVALHCGFNLTSHHNALADSEACAAIAMKVL
jgi:DNA polymerase-3 subunit epsilon